MIFHSLVRGSAACLAMSLLALTPGRSETSFLIADGPGGTYPMIQAAGFNIENDDCKDHVEHMTELWNDELKKNVFQFTLHKNDDDRCARFDRQRCELRGIGPAQQCPPGTDAIWRWKFRLPPDYHTISNFNHIMQIKGYGNGHGSESPIFTLTVRGGDFEIWNRSTKKTAPISSFLGVWAEVYMKTHIAKGGTVDIQIKRVSDGAPLVAWQGTNCDLFDNGAGYSTCKFGNYRRLTSDLHDENVLFADWSITKGLVEAPWPNGNTAARATIAPLKTGDMPALRFLGEGALPPGYEAFDTKGNRVPAPRGGVYLIRPAQK
jgi:hypothetical protein